MERIVKSSNEHLKSNTIIFRIEWSCLYIETFCCSNIEKKVNTQRSSINVIIYESE